MMTNLMKDPLKTSAPQYNPCTKQTEHNIQQSECFMSTYIQYLPTYASTYSKQYGSVMLWTCAIVTYLEFYENCTHIQYPPLSEDFPFPWYYPVHLSMTQMYLEDSTHIWKTNYLPTGDSMAGSSM